MASTGSSTPGLPKRGSRKGKKEWRRNIDVSDAVATLYERSENERHGIQANLKNADDSVLFELDRTGDIDASSKRRKASVATILQAASGELEGPTSTNAARKRKSAEKNALVTAPSELPIGSKAWLSRTEAAIVMKKAKNMKMGIAKATFPSDLDGCKKIDLWEPKDAADAFSAPLISYAAPKPAAPTEPKAKLAVPAIPTIGSSSSYNPTAAALAAVRQDNERQRKVREMALQDVNSAKLVSAKKKKKNSYLEPIDKELLAPRNAKDDADAAEVLAGEEEMLKRREPRALTKAERNKKKRAKVLKQALEEARKRKRTIEGAANAAQLGAKVKLWKKKLERRRLLREKARRLREIMPQQLSRYTMIPSSETPHAEETDGQFVLRNVKPVRNLLREQFASFQMRNMIEARIKTKCTRKFALKTYEQRSYKDFDQGIM